MFELTDKWIISQVELSLMVVVAGVVIAIIAVLRRVSDHRAQKVDFIKFSKALDEMNRKRHRQSHASD